MKFSISAVVFALALSVQASPNPIPDPAVTPTPTIGVLCPVASCGTRTVTIGPPRYCAAVECPAIACPLLIRVTEVPCCCKNAKLPVTVTTQRCCPTCVIPTETLYACPVTVTAEPTA
ncbi:hypothetical protein TWF694_004460 [Orbilia ellipsospora]|uniref:Uncharacterized protein n=1 Tax=Orbilia ellipsospora TaxID=2528407 RepID=A0AAV9WVC7_9PEZI